MNPVATADGLKLNVSEYDNAQDLDLAKEVAPYFRLTALQAGKVISTIVAAVNGWQETAASLGIPASEQARMARAFRVASR